MAESSEAPFGATQSENLQTYASKRPSVHEMLSVKHRPGIHHAATDILAMSNIRHYESAHEISRSDISPKLRDLDRKSPEEQIAFWQKCLLKKQDELDELGGLPPDCIANDVLTRYFDSSARGISLVFMSAHRDQEGEKAKGEDHEEVLNRDGLYDALSEHYNFYPKLEEEERYGLKENKCKIEQFERLCEFIEPPCNKETFGYCVRRLRIVLLLEEFRLKSNDDSFGKVFHMDYDDDDIHTMFNSHMEKKEVVRAGKTFKVPVIPPQYHVNDFVEYFFTSKTARKGRVHWTHLHFAAIELLLGVGQVWRLPGPALGMLCNLHKAQPQITYVDPHTIHSKEDERGYLWSYMVIPDVHLDNASAENLALYRRWFEMRQDPAERKMVSPIPPRVHVAVTNMKLGIMWSSLQANTLLTAETEPYYIGKWTTDADDRKQGAYATLLDKVTCKGCCTKRNKAGNDGLGDYEKLSTEDEDMEAGLPLYKYPGLKQALEQNVVEAHTHAGQRADQKDQSCCTFEKSFHQVLAVLEKQNSMLRLGDHWHLMMRIILNRTVEYLDVLELYEAAITRLSFLLRDENTEDKDDLVAKIEMVKLELDALKRLIDPFADYVVPDLCHLADKLHDEYPLVYHHVKDIQNNVRMFGPKCKSLISRCGNLTNEYDRIAGDKTNAILNILTFITFVITPMQLMTGLYGMNFRIMPELNWDHGYFYFWCLSITLSILFALILVCLRRG